MKLDKARVHPSGAPRELMSWALVLLLGVGCGGGAAPPTPEPAPPGESAGAERSASDDEGMEISGQLGTIPAAKIDRTLQRRLGTFQRCFFEGMGEVEFLGGAIEFMFRVGHDGRPEWVHPHAATIGHRGTERCLLKRAQETDFPVPRGGDAAEFLWGFELDPPGGVRPPVVWEEGQIEPARGALVDTASTCGASEVKVTAYVSPGGAVLAAGVASEARLPASVLDCVVDGVKALTLPDPGSYTAKVTFQVP